MDKGKISRLAASVAGAKAALKDAEASASAHERALREAEELLDTEEIKALSDMWLLDESHEIKTSLFDLARRVEKGE